MSISLSKSKIAIVLLVISLFHFFAILRTSNVIYSADLVNVLVIFFTAFFVLFSNGHILTNKYINHGYIAWIFFTLILWGIQIIHSVIAYHKYGQTFVQVLSVAYAMLSVFAFFPFSYYQEKVDNIDCLKKVIEYASVIAAVLNIFQVFLYNYGITFLDLGTLGLANQRNGLRWGLGQYVVAISLMMSLFDAINLAEHRMQNVLLSALYLFDVIYAVKTRSLELYLIITIYFIIFFCLKGFNARILLSIVGVAALLYLVYANVIGSFYGELAQDAGVNIRINAIAFYLKQFIEHPILGMGYIKASTAGTHLLELLRGPLWFGTTRYYFRDDVGFIGLLNENGIIGAIWYIWALILLFKESRYLYKKDYKHYTWCIASLIFITLCSVNLIYTTSGMFPILVMVMSLVHHYYIHENDMVAEWI